MGLEILSGLVVVAVPFGWLARADLRRSELRAFDEPPEVPFFERSEPSEGPTDVLARIRTLSVGGGLGKKRLHALRAQLDTLFALEDLSADVRSAGVGSTRPALLTCPPRSRPGLMGSTSGTCSARSWKKPVKRSARSRSPSSAVCPAG